MSIRHKPIAGHWYETADSQSLKVINVDVEGDTIEVQYLGGAHEEIDFAVWNRWEVESIVPPRDWEGMCDDDPDDYPDEAYKGDNSANDELWNNEDKFFDEESEN